MVTMILFSLSLVGGCTSSGDQGQESSSKDSSGVPVRAYTVESRTLEETVEAIGTLRANRTVQISPEIEGRIETVNFTEGEIVNRGDTLAKLDDDRLRQNYQAKQHALEEAQANLENARLTYQRNKRLHQKDMIPDQQFDTSKAQFEAARARVNQLQAEVNAVREQLEDAVILAPHAGVIGAREVDPGNYVSPGTVLAVLYQLDPLQVDFTVPGRFAGRIRTGQPVRGHVASLPDTALEGEVFFVSPSIREQTRDLLVKARINNPNRSAKPGAFARVRLTLETLKDRPVVPSESLVGTTEGYIIFTVKNGKAQRQPVKIGLRQPGWVEIRTGVQPGERIVKSGHQSLTDGSPVNILNGND